MSNRNKGFLSAGPGRLKRKLQPLLSIGEAMPGVSGVRNECPVLGPQYNRDMDTLERGPQDVGPQSCWRAWSTSPMRKGRESRDHLARERGGLEGISSMSINSWREDAMKVELCYFQWCPPSGQEAMGTNLDAGGSVWTWGSILLCRCWSSGADYQWGCGISSSEMFRSHLDVVLVNWL